MEVLAPKNHLGPYTRWTGPAGTLKMAGQMGFGEDTAAEGLGFTTPKHKDWFGDQDVEVQALLNTMHTAHLAWIIDKSSPVKKSAYTRGRNEAQMVAVKS